MQPSNNVSPFARFINKRSLAVSLVVTLIVVVGFIGFSLTDKPASSGERCLTVNDLADLTGTTIEDTFSLTDNFYTSTIGFKDGESYSEPKAAKNTLRSFGDFYKSHPTKSMIFTLGSDYEENGGEPLAANRLDRVTADLRSSGVDENAILASTPKQIEDEEDASTSFVTISITSGSSCK